MALLDEATWQSKIFSNGWSAGAAGDAAVIEPATGEQLGRVGMAGAADVARAATSAARAQRDWAALPHTQRAAVLRRAGDLWTTHADEVHHWLVREAGSIPPKAGTETHVAEQECYEAATLPSRAYGRLHPSELER